MKRYGTSARDYLGRAKNRLAEDSPESVFYAALELRCGVEARLREYLEPQRHVKAREKAQWNAGKLATSITKAFRTNKVSRVVIANKTTGTILGTYFYTPVTDELRRLAERLGSYLHAAKEAKALDDPWWQTFRAHVTRTASLLEEATAGTLLGPLIRQGKTNLVNMRAEVIGEAPDPSKWPRDNVMITVEYFDTIAEAQDAS